MDTCSACAAELPVGAKYCSACGAAVVHAGARGDPSAPEAGSSFESACPREDAAAAGPSLPAEGASPFGAAPSYGAPSTYDAPHYGAPSPYGAPSYGTLPPYWQPPAADWRAAPSAAPYASGASGMASPAPLAGHWPPPATPQSGATAPGIGVAGFILAVLGVFTSGVTCLVGLPLSVVGYVQARREGRPSGLCLAGIIISAVGIAILVAAVIFMLVALAPLTEVAPNPYTY